MKKKVVNKDTLQKKYRKFTWYEQSMWCKKCDVELEFTGWQLHTTDLGRYKHKCPKCKKTWMLMENYPHAAREWESPPKWAVWADKKQKKT